MATKKTPEPPLIDERIEFRGTSHLRNMTADVLRELTTIVVIQDGIGSERLAVLLPYSQYIALQKAATA
jgi:hypothetical protein